VPAVPARPVASDLFVNNISADCDGADCQFYIPTLVTDRGV